MKRILIGFTVVMLLVFVSLLFVNAGKSTKNEIKQLTEVKMCGTKGSCMMQSSNNIAGKSQVCDTLKCNTANCDPEKCRNSSCSGTNCMQSTNKSASE